MPDIGNSEILSSGLEKSIPKPIEKPPEQKKISEGAKSLADRIAGWFKKSPSNPDINPDVILKDIANLPLEQTKSEVQVKTPVEIPVEPKVEPKIETKVEQKIEEVVDLSPENITKSQQEYIVWRRSQSEGFTPEDPTYNGAVEPGRATVWGHATSLEGAIRTLVSGKVKSAKAILLEDETLAHAPTNRAGSFQSKEIQQGLTLSQLTSLQEKQALNSAVSYVSGTLGKLLENYTSNKEDPSLQVGIVFPLEVLNSQGLKMREAFGQIPGQNKEIPPERLEMAQQKLELLSNKLFSSEYLGTRELNVMDFDKDGKIVPTTISAEGGVMLVQEGNIESLKVEITKRMQEHGKTPADIEKSLDQVVGFSTEFKSVDEALGWITNTPEGKGLIFQKTGVKIEPPQAKIKPESEYVKDFIADYESKIREELLGVEGAEKQGWADVVESRTKDIASYEREINKLKDKLASGQKKAA